MRIRKVKAQSRRDFLAALLLAALMLPIVAAHVQASKIDDEIQGTIQDEEESSTFFKKDMRFVLVPIPISNPTIGTGLAVGFDVTYGDDRVEFYVQIGDWFTK